MPRFYVYALIDPRTGCPKYVGKGLSARTEAHVRESATVPDDALVVGAATADVWAADQDGTLQDASSKKAWLHELLGLGFSHADIARVIARDLDERSAFTLESLLIHHVYGKAGLLNVQAGHHAERFRPKGHWGAWNDEALAAAHDWYVYVLRNPNTSCDNRDGVFYVGKGSGQRLDMHFLDANRFPGDPAAPERLRTIRTLLDEGLRPDQIGYVVARFATEQEAFLSEALLIKFVYGVNALTNRVAGHHAWAIRPKDHWAVLPGFDLARVVNPGIREDRSELLELLLAEGLSASLDRVRQLLAETLMFGDYMVLDSGELGMEAQLGGTVLKVFTRRKKIQLELRPRRKEQRAWMLHRFDSLGAGHLLRGDTVFIPPSWRGSRGMTESATEIAARARLLAQLTGDLPYEGLSAEAQSLLEPPEIPANRDAPLPGDVPEVLATGPEAVPAPPLMPLADPEEIGATPPTPDATDPANEDCPTRLQEIAEQFPDIDFDLPRRRDAGEIAIEGLIGAEGIALGATLKVSCRKSGYGLELRGRTLNRRAWLYERLSLLGCTLRRAMNPEEVVFLPAQWKGSAGIAKTVEVAVHRIALLQQIVSTTNPDDLDDEARGLLDE